MPIPKSYREILVELATATSAGRVDWTATSSASLVLALPEFKLELWRGDDEGKSFIACGMKDPAGSSFIDNWFIEEGEDDFVMLDELFKDARRRANRVDEKLAQLSAFLKKGGKLGP